MDAEESETQALNETAVAYAGPQFPALRDPRYPVSRMAHVLELIGENYDALRKGVGEMIELIQRGLPQFFPKPPTNNS